MQVNGNKIIEKSWKCILIRNNQFIEKSWIEFSMHSKCISWEIIVALLLSRTLEIEDGIYLKPN